MAVNNSISKEYNLARLMAYLGGHMAEFSVERFEGSGRENGTRYWYAHEFMSALGYDSWKSFQGVITKAMGSCAKLNIDPTEAFNVENLVVGEKTVKTYRLNRFACFLI